MANVIAEGEAYSLVEQLWHSCEGLSNKVERGVIQSFALIEQASLRTV